MRIARPLPLLLVLVAVFAAGCGSSSDEGDETRATTSGGAVENADGAESTDAGAVEDAGADEGEEATTPGGAPPGASATDCGPTTVRGTEQLRVTGVSCAVGRGVVVGWVASKDCQKQTNSRPACSVYDYRCIGLRTDAGVAVSCARRGRSLSFIARRS